MIHITATWQRSITAVVAAAGMLVTGCSDDGGSGSSDGAQPASIAEVCLSVGGTLTQLSGDTWNCGDIPEPDNEEYLRINEAFAPFCKEPMGFSNGYTSAEPPTMGWACWVDDGTDETSGGDGQPATAVEEACIVVGGTYTVTDDGGWSCLDVPLDDSVTFEYADGLLAPYCSLPMIFTNGWGGDNPPLHGWSCSLPPEATAMSALEACEALGGTFVDRGPEGFTCDNAVVGTAEYYPYVDEYFNAFCDEAMVLTSGVSDDGDPLVAGWSCSQP